MSGTIENLPLTGMTGLSKGAVDRLRDEYSVYAIDTGRICVAALNSHNIDHVTEAVAKVVG